MRCCHRSVQILVACAASAEETPREVWFVRFRVHCVSPGVAKLGIKKFQAKIGLDNQVSVAMFKKLHFNEVRWRHLFARGGPLLKRDPPFSAAFPVQVSVCDVFKEVTLELTVDAKLQDDVAHMTERDYRQACSSRRELSSR